MSKQTTLEQSSGKRVHNETISEWTSILVFYLLCSLSVKTSVPLNIKMLLLNKSAKNKNKNLLILGPHIQMWTPVFSLKRPKKISTSLQDQDLFNCAFPLKVGKDQDNLALSGAPKQQSESSKCPLLASRENCKPFLLSEEPSRKRMCLQQSLSV